MDALDRTFRHLVQTIERLYPAYLHQPFEVAELYQNILPYRHHRRELGLETNQDYELVLLQLLAGARDYLIVDAAMRERLAQELAQPNPDPGAFREFATTQIAISPAALRRFAPAAETAAAADGAAAGAAEFGPPRPSVPAPPLPPPPAPQAAPAPRASAQRTTSQRAAVAAAGEPPAASVSRAAAAPRASAAPRGDGAANAPTAPRAGATIRAPELRPSPPAPAPAPPSAPVTPTPRTSNTIMPSAGETCRFCSGALPTDRRITFCPHCGHNLTVVNCLACGTELDLGWKFCTTCGRPAAT